MAILTAVLLLGQLVLCAPIVWAQTTPDAPRPAAPGTPGGEPKPAPRGGDSPGDFRPAKPDVYYLRDRDGKLVPVPDFTYEDFRRLYDLDQRLTSAAAPPRFVVSQLLAVGKVEGDYAQLSLQVRVTTKTEGWVSIPLRFAGAVLREQPKYDGSGNILVEYHRERDGYVVWLQEADSKPHTISLDVMVPIRKTGGTRRLAFQAPASAVSELRLSVPGKRISANVSEGAGLIGVRPGEGEWAEIQAAGLSGDFQLSWIDSPSDAASIPATIEASAAILTRVEGPGRLTSEARLKVRSYGIPLTTFRVKFPAGLDWFPLNEPGYRVNLVETLRPEGQPPVHVVEVTMDNKSGNAAEIRLRAVSPAREAAAGDRLETLGFEVVGAVRQFGLVDFIIDGDWSVTWPERVNVQQVEVPDSLRQQRVVARFEYFRQPSSLSVLVQPRRTRVYVEPEYTVHVGPQTLRLTAVLRYRVRGPAADHVQLDLAGWKLDRLQPESLVDRDQAREVSPGVLSLPISREAGTTAQDFELRMEASRLPGVAGDTLTIPLPRPRADALSPARLTVIPAENVSLSPRLRDMPGVVAQIAPATVAAGGTAPQQRTFEVRADIEQPRFVADFKLRARQMTVGAEHRLRVEARRIVVEQRYNCQVLYEPLRQLRLAVPASVSAAGLQVFLERASGDLDALTPVPEPPPVEAEPAAVVQTVDLVPEPLGEFAVLVRYSVPWTPAGPESATTTVALPLVMPVEEPATRLGANSLRIAADPSWQLELPDVGWVPDLRVAEGDDAGRQMVWTVAGWADHVTLEITPVRSLENLGTVVRQAWVQSWFGRQWRQDRVVLRVQSSERRMVVTLPPQVPREDLLVAVDGRRIQPGTTADGGLRVDWGAADIRLERTVELSYLVPREQGRTGRLTVSLPQVVGARGEQRWLWQLVLPPTEHLIAPPAGWVAQRRWLWQAGFIDQRMIGTQGELEQALHAAPQVEPPAEANQYLFSSFAPPAELEIQVIDRTVLVLVASGAILLLGLLLMYSPRLRHPGMLWLVAVAGAGLSALAPSLAVLGLQAAALGLVLVMCGLFVRRLVRRRQSQRTILRGTAVSVLDKPLSDARLPRVDSGVQATTATLPPVASVLWLLVGGWGLLGNITETRGQTTPPPASAPSATAPARADRSWGFRRVLVREEQIPTLTRGHLPIAREEFESLLAAAQRQLPENAPLTQIEQADYVTRWESPGRMTGEAWLRVRHSRQSPALLSLDPCDVPIFEPGWLVEGRSASDPAVERPATNTAEPTGVEVAGGGRFEALIGAAPGQGPCLVVERSGVLNWRFTLRGEGEGESVTRLRVRLPRSPRQRWWLELPDPLILHASDAVVWGPGAETLLPDVPSAVRSTPGRTWWCVALGGRTELDCSVRSPAASEPWTPPFSWRQDCHYDVGINGTEVRASFRLDISAESLSSVAIELPATLHIGSIRLGDVALTWTTREGETPGKQEVQVEVPDLSGHDRLLSITALAATTLNATWELPRIQCLGGFWQETQTTLTVLDPLQVRSLQIERGRQTQVSSLASPVAGVSLGFQFHDQDGRVAVELGVPPAQLRVLAGTSVVVDATTLTARAEVAVSVARGRPFRLAADVPQHWIVDGIEVTPESWVEDYAWEPSPRPGQQRLTIQLRNPLPRDRELRVDLRVHRPRAADEVQIRSQSLRVIDFTADAELAVDGRYLVALRSDPAAPLQFRGDGDLTWLQVDQLASPEAELLDVTADQFYVDGREADRLVGVAERTPAAFVADLELAARTLPGRLLERYRITCEPRGAPVSRFVALFSQTRAAPLKWRMADDDEALFTARRLSDTELAAVTRAAGEGWEVVLRAPQSKAFTLTAERVSPWSDRLPLSLVSLPESERQRGGLRIESVGTPALVGQVGLEGVPASVAEPNEAAQWIAGYRYDPARSPLITVSPGPANGAAEQEAGTSLAWIWSLRLVTHHREDGACFHDLYAALENRGRRQVVLRLPADAKGLALAINGVPRTFPVERGPRELAVTIPLPAGESQIAMRLSFRTQQAPLQFGAVLRPVQPQFDIPVLSQEWTACVPAAYQRYRRFTSGGRRAEEVGPDAAVTATGPEQLFQRLVALVIPRAAADSAIAVGEESRGFADERGHDELRDPSLVWSQFTLRASSLDRCEIRVVHGDWIQSGGWVLLFVVAGTVAWGGIRLLGWVPVVVCGLAAAVPWWPECWDPLSSGVLLGLLLGAALVLVRRSQTPELARAPQEGSTRRLARYAPAGGAVLVLLGSWGGATYRANGQEPPAAVAPQEELPVLYPVDEEGRPVGAYVYVPQGLYQELRRRSIGGAKDLPGWLWRSASYRAVVRESTDALGEASPGWEVTSLAAVWTVDVLSAPQRVTIPVGVTWSTLLSQRIQRDGRDLELLLENDGSAWGVVLPEPGRYQIQVLGRPPLRLRPENNGTRPSNPVPWSDRWGFAQVVPRIPDSRLSIEFPDGQRWLELPTVRGAVSRDGPGREWRADLGPVDQLTIEGAAGAADANPAMPVDVEQLAWFHVRPGSVTLETIWNFSAVNGRLPRRARISVDPRLRLLPLSPDQPVTQVTPPDVATPWIQWEWAEAVTDTARIRLSFLVAGASGVGQWKLPPFTPWQTRLSRRLLAVSLGPSLEIERTGPATLQPIGVAEFQEAWGEPASAPQFAYRVSAGEAPWSLVTRVRPARVTAAEVTELSVDAGWARLQWSADVELQEGVLWQHAVTVPETLEVRDVALVDRAREENRILQWSRPEPGLLQILLNAPLDGPHRLTLQGELPLGEPALEFPTVTLAEIPLQSQRRVLYRQPTVTVQWNDPAPAGVARTDVAEFRAGWGRRIAEWRLPVPESREMADRWLLQVSPNRAQPRARVGTTVMAGEEGLVSEIGVQVMLEAGEWDALRLEMSADWPEQLDMDPPLPYHWQFRPERDRKVLTLRPNMPWTKSFSLRLRGPTAVEDEERGLLPDVRVLDMEDAEYYLWLPRRDWTRSVAWETSGLQATRWPEGVPFGRWPGARGEVVPVPDSDEGTAYRVVGSRYRATLRDAEGVPAAPRVRLADHFAFLDARAGGWGASILDLEAAGRADCVVGLPADCQLVDLRLDGRRVRRQALAPRRWRVELAAAEWPQRLEVVFRVEPAQGMAGPPARDLPCAEIIDWPVVHFLGTLSAEGTVDAGGSPLTSTASGAITQDLERLAAASEGAETAAESLASHPRRDALDWWPAWQTRFSAIELRLLAPPSDGRLWSRPDPGQSDVWRRRFQLAKSRLRIADLPWPAPESSRLPAPPDWERRLAGLEPVRGTATTRVRWVQRGVSEPLVVRWRPPPTGRTPEAGIWSALAILLGFVWLTWTAGGRAAQAWARWPQLGLVLAGLAWWAGSTWPLVGLALVAVGVLAALRGDWGHRVPAKR
ncbi:MAG: hypothetical protein U0935_18625 [Pirellulales bacterium]